MNKKKLYRSNNDKMLAGICGGIAEYFGWDSTLVRIATVALSFFYGIVIVLYIAGIFIIPTKPISNNVRKDVEAEETTIKEDD